jgi:(R,R)-butanediol dehydrogenase / meso-butanediol dehydrogenase / diacetyl reductase
MFQAVYRSARTITVSEADPAEPGPGQVRIDVAYTGICGTDLHIYHGDMDARVGAPAVIGHEMSGRIAALGPGAGGWAVGDPVTVMPLDWCGTCAACRAGNSHVCQNLTFIGIDAPGAMQQSWVVPARTLVALPAGLPLAQAAVVEPTAVAVHDVGRAAVAAGEKVLVVGGGPVGTLIALVARQADADVVVAEPDAFRRDFAISLGLEAIDPAATDVSAFVDTWTRGAGVPVTFEVSGAAAGLGAAVECLGVRGRLCLVAIHPRPREVNLHRFFWRELHLVGARLYDRSDFQRAVELVAAGTVRADKFVTTVEPLSRTAAAFEALESGSGQMKILIDCTQAG